VETTTLQTTLVNWLHLSAAMVWLGAIFTGAAVFFRKDDGHIHAAKGKLSAAFYRVFSPYAWAALAVLVITGSLRAAGHLEGGVGDLLTTVWGRLLSAKLVLVMLLVGIGAYVTYGLAPRIDARPKTALEVERHAALELRLRILCALGALMGLGILFIVTLL